jgi:carbamoyltransferase
MGLASYGKPIYDVGLRHTPDGPRWIGVPQPTTTGRALPPQRTEQLLSFFQERCYPYTAGLKDDITAYIDFAASVQHTVEETILELARDLHVRTGSSNICLAGGVALNCSTNGRLATEGPFSNIFVQPMAHAGVSLGAAYEVARQIAPAQFRPQRMTHSLWGPEFDDAQIAAALRNHGLIGERLPPAA